MDRARSSLVFGPLFGVLAGAGTQPASVPSDRMFLLWPRDLETSSGPRTLTRHTAAPRGISRPLIRRVF
jgi:hypothetical protein